jgi:hypothetical protein
MVQTIQKKLDSFNTSLSTIYFAYYQAPVLNIIQEWHIRCIYYFADEGILAL